MEKYYRVCAGISGLVNVKEFISPGEQFYVEIVPGGLNLHHIDWVEKHPKTRPKMAHYKKKKKAGLRVVKALTPKNTATVVLILGFAFGGGTIGLIFCKKRYGWEVRAAADSDRHMAQRTSLGNVGYTGYFLFTDEERDRLGINDPDTAFIVRVKVSPEEGNFIKLTKIRAGSEPELMCRRPVCKTSDPKDFTYVWTSSEVKGGFFYLPAVFRTMLQLGVTKLKTHFEEDDNVFVIEGPARVCPVCGKDYSSFDTSAAACPECFGTLFEELAHGKFPWEE